VEELVKTAAYYVALAAEAAAVLIIVIGALRALSRFFTCAVPRRCAHNEMLRIRIQLGNALSLGLEFLIGADILKTAVAPSWTDLGQLAAIVGIRIVLNFFLMREIEHEQDEIRESGQSV